AYEEGFVVTWDWINDSHFWGGNVENELPADAAEATIDSGYVLTYKGQPASQRTLTIDFSGSTGIITGPGYEGLVAYFWNEAGTVGSFSDIKVTGQVGVCVVPEGADHVKVIRTPAYEEGFVVTWDWINDSHFWGGNVENELPADAAEATIDSGYVLTYK
ncbi:MAG: hypothetical protein J5736_05680, partial [Bacilli bacterium]|nr:hypothetical protein [Bacilli bacterium]